MAGRHGGGAHAFAAIDFETANYSRDSACAIGVAIVEDGEIVTLDRYLIRPPSRDFCFTYIHGLTWEDVRDAPTFSQVWAAVARKLRPVKFLAAHNASFDQGVLDACCQTWGLRQPELPFVCTVSLARAVWQIYPTTLPDVCRHLRIPLKHHEAGSDAEACARIVLNAFERGWQP
jgi:DNA polymerase-3 subunit epsilon